MKFHSIDTRTFLRNQYPVNMNYKRSRDIFGYIPSPKAIYIYIYLLILRVVDQSDSSLIILDYSFAERCWPVYISSYNSTTVNYFNHQNDRLDHDHFLQKTSGQIELIPPLELIHKDPANIFIYTLSQGNENHCLIYSSEGYENHFKVDTSRYF